MIKKSILAGFILSILAGANNISTGGRTHDSSNYNSEGKKAEGSDNLLTFRKSSGGNGNINYPAPLPPPPPPPVTRAPVVAVPRAPRAPVAAVDIFLTEVHYRWKGRSTGWNINSSGVTIGSNGFSTRIYHGPRFTIKSSDCGSGTGWKEFGSGRFAICDGFITVASRWRGGFRRYRSWWFAFDR